MYWHKTDGDYESNQRWKRHDAATDLATADRCLGVEADQDDTQSAEHQIGAELVDYDSDRHPAGPVERLYHGQADERGIAEASDDRQGAYGRSRQLQATADGPEQDHAGCEQ